MCKREMPIHFKGHPKVLYMAFWQTRKQINSAYATTLNKYVQNQQHIMGASTVKWTTLDPCSYLSESDPKLYTKFEFHEIEIYKYLDNI